MKVLAVSGSPHESNTELMLGKAVQGCVVSGAEVELVLLRKMNFRGCCGKNSCFYENYCDVKDEMQGLYEKMLSADALILASPVYFNSVSGLMKNFLDRTNPYCRPPKFEGKPVALISVGGHSIRAVKLCGAYLKEFCRIHKMPVIASVNAVADKENEILSNEKALNECIELGKKLVNELKKRKKKEKQKTNYFYNHSNSK